MTDFDEFAESYTTALQEGLSVSGEDAAYFANGRVAFLAECLEHLRCRPKSVMDFGCGIGTTAPLLRGLRGVSRVFGVDESVKSIEVATSQNGDPDIRFTSALGDSPPCDLIYCNGVFHHLKPEGQGKVLSYMHDKTRPGGLVSLWENNPWNPGVRYIMKKIPFDRDAVPVRPGSLRVMLVRHGFEVLRTDFLFLFPRWLRALRGIEPILGALPLGAQYQVLARRLPS